MLPTNWRVELNKIDISNKVLDISNIDTSLDAYNPTEFTVNEARIQAGYPFPDGLANGSDVDIFAGNKKIFSGIITKITKDVKGHLADVIIDDITRNMRDKNLDDFGISKRVRVSKSGDTESGEYPFTNKLSPVSNESIKNPKSGEIGLNLVDTFVSEGALEPTNITYDEDTLRSEGESLEQDPDITLKSPYRHKGITFIINKILEYYGIENSVVLKDDLVLERDYFSTNGRIGYEIESNIDLDTDDPNKIGSHTSIFWTGLISDYIFYDGKWYFIYTSRINNSSILVYNPATDTLEKFYSREDENKPHAEWWKFVRFGNVFYILGTTISSVLVNNPTLGAYDPTEPNSGTFIEKLDITDNALTTFIDSNHAYPAVVGTYYQMGFPVDGENNNVRRGIQPDTRHGFIFKDPYLYYRYADRVSCGVARFNKDGASAPERVVIIPRDNYFNHLTFDFFIRDNYLYGGSVFQRESNSTRTLFKTSIT